MVLKGILSGANDQEIEKIDDFMFSMFAPEKFDGSDGKEVKHIKGFEESCIMINKFVPKDPKKMTVLEYYQTLEFMKEQYQKEKKYAKPNFNK